MTPDGRLQEKQHRNFPNSDNSPSRSQQRGRGEEFRVTERVSSDLGGEELFDFSN